MNDSRYLNELIGVMDDIGEEKVNSLLLVYGGEKVKREIPFDSLLSQYKYCLNHNIKDSAFSELKRLLSNICSENIIAELEEVYNGD